MVRQANKQPAEPKDVGALIGDALDKSGITQYELAKRLAEIRGTHLGSQDQAIRRIRKQGQTPTDDVARDLVKAFKPELKLAADYFVSERRSAVESRQAALEALEEIQALRAKVEKLEDQFQQLSRTVSRQRRASP